jgi:hypothetical protein
VFGRSTLRELAEAVTAELLGDASGEEVAQMVADAEVREG